MLTKKERFRKALDLPFVRKLREGKGYWLRVAVLTACGIAAGHALENHDAILHFRYRLYELQTRYLAPTKSAALNTVFVAIDDDAFWKGELARRLPLKRDYLAKLVQAVSDANPRAIVLDFDLRSPTSDGSPVSFSDYNDETAKFFQTLQTVAEHHKLILPRSVDAGTDGHLQQQSDIFDHFSFGKGAANVYRGYIQFQYDLRTIPLCEGLSTGPLDSLALAMLHATYPDAYQEIADPTAEGCSPEREVDFKFGRFISAEKLVKRQFSAGAVLRNDPEIMKSISGNVVIICGTWHQHSYNLGPPVDVHDSPSGEIPGAFLHANYYEALVQGHYLNSMSETLIDAIEVFAVFFAAGIMFRTTKPAWRIAAAFTPAVVMLFCSYVFLQNLGAFFECSIPVIVLLCHLALDHILEWRDLALEHECRKLEAI